MIIINSWMIVTLWSFAQHQRLGVPPPSRLPRRLHRGLDLQWDFKIKKSEICPYSWNRRQIKNHGFLQHLSLKTLELWWLQDTINTCFAKEMENHMITETKEPSKFVGGVPQRPGTWTLAGGPWQPWQEPPRGPRQFFERSNYFPSSHGFGPGSPMGCGLWTTGAQWCPPVR